MTIVSLVVDAVTLPVVIDSLSVADRTICVETASNRYLRLEECWNLRAIGVEAFDAAEDVLIRRAQYAVMATEGLLESLEVLALLNASYSRTLVSR